METAPRKYTKHISEEERKERKEWEQRVREEEQRMREQREQHIVRVKLTDEQRKLRRYIRSKICGYRIRMKRKAQWQKLEADGQLLRRAPPAHKKYISEKEQQLRQQWEQRVQEEEERLRKEREHHLPRATKLTVEQKRMRMVAQNRACRARKKRNAAKDEKAKLSPVGVSEKNASEEEGQV